MLAIDDIKSGSFSLGSLLLVIFILAISVGLITGKAALTPGKNSVVNSEGISEKRRERELQSAKTAYESSLTRLASAEMTYNRDPNNSSAIENLARARQFASQAEANYLSKSMQKK